MPQELDPNQPPQSDNPDAGLEFDFSNPNAKPEFTPNPDSLADGFLKEIDPNDRPYVEKYVKQWDGNVTKKFQSIHEQYAPYKELGDLDEIKSVKLLAESFNTDPIGTLNHIVNTYRNLGLDMSDFNYSPDDRDDTPVGNQEPAPQSWAPAQEEWEQMKQFMLGLGTNYLETQKAAQAAADKAEFDGFLKNLHNEHGDFDDDWVTNQLAKGVDPKDAVEAFNKMIESRVNSRTNRPAPIFPGGGSPGQVKDVDVSKLTPEQRRDYVAARIAAGNH